eukprot:14906949-Alexandrium_andersonii.AAC.1
MPGDPALLPHVPALRRRRRAAAAGRLGRRRRGTPGPATDAEAPNEACEQQQRLPQDGPRQLQFQTHHRRQH